MENTLANKEKVFALYWGQNLAKITKVSYTHPLDTVHVVDKNVISSVESEKFVKHKYSLDLKPISSISDEDKAHLGLEYLVSFDEYGYNYSIGGDSWDIYQVDYLRSKGYAVAAYGLSLEELVNRGWVVLISPNSPTTD